MIKKMKSWGILMAFLMTVTTTSSGCFWLVVGAAAGAGTYAWVKGELTKNYNVSADRLHTAAIKGLKKIGTPIREDIHDRLSAKIASEFSDGAGISIKIEAVTEKAAKITVRIGALGDKTRSEMVLNAIEGYI